MILEEMEPLVDTDVSWHQEAACRGYATTRFFIEAKSADQPEQLREARQICGLCPVRKRCLDYALNNHIHHGIWGGYTTKQRRGIRRDRRNRV
jgi:WhiB family redox-sensing transcriptional regulator